MYKVAVILVKQYNGELRFVKRGKSILEIKKYIVLSLRKSIREIRVFYLVNLLYQSFFELLPDNNS